MWFFIKRLFDAAVHSCEIKSAISDSITFDNADGGPFSVSVCIFATTTASLYFQESQDFRRNGVQSTLVFLSLSIYVLVGKAVPLIRPV